MEIPIGSVGASSQVTPLKVLVYHALFQSNAVILLA